MEKLAALMSRLNVSERISEFDLKGFEQKKVDDYNKQEGTKHLEDGYNCPLCKNRGDIAEVMEYPPGVWQWKAVPCKCQKARHSIRMMNKSGLGNIIKEKTFDRYETPDPWQVPIKKAAMEYAKDGDWFFLGGQSGAGKTHLCTAICREFLLAGKGVAYMMWADDSNRLKNWEMEWEEREALLRRFKKTEVLYIDDLWKPARDNGVKQRPTGADIRLAFEIINFRYNDPKLKTIVSSEWNQDELLSIDQATGGRIFERAGRYGLSISENDDRNWRTRGGRTV